MFPIDFIGNNNSFLYPKNHVNPKSDPPEVNDNYTRDLVSGKIWPQALLSIYGSFGEIIWSTTPVQLHEK